MAFKLIYTAQCEKCPKQIETFSHNEQEANRNFTEQDWYAHLNIHL